VLTSVRVASYRCDFRAMQLVLGVVTKEKLELKMLKGWWWGEVTDLVGCHMDRQDFRSHVSMRRGADLGYRITNMGALKA